MADFVLVRADAHNRHLADSLDGTFTVESRLRLQAAADHISYRVEAVTPYLKHYAGEDADAAAPRIADRYLHSETAAAWLALVQGKAAGLLLLSHGWNGFGLIEQIEVDRAQRRRGLGTRLLAQAEEWARERGLAGLRLETQDVNVAACELYARNGFVLGGFDRCLYAAIPAHAAETALYWYRLFDRT